MDNRQIDRKEFLTLSLTLTGVWLTDCGGDDNADGTGGEAGMAGGDGGTAGEGNGGNAGSAMGGTAGDGAGGAAGKGMSGGAGEGAGAAGEGGADGGGGAGGAGGTSGSGGTMGGAGKGGMGGAGKGGMGGAGKGGMGGAGKGGGGGGDMCENGAFGITQTAATPDTVTHDHLTGAGNTLSTATTLVMQINAGTPLSFMLPSDGAPDHVHVLTFTAQDYMTLRSGGMVSKMTGLDDSGHRHTYAIECMS